eukprot:m.61803 g.61803  ORF g.61803 m.61803 type:complete len:88 (-) comp13358_c0_seq2:1013-1276(-)
MNNINIYIYIYMYPRGTESMLSTEGDRRENLGVHNTLQQIVGRPLLEKKKQLLGDWLHIEKWYAAEQVRRVSMQSDCVDGLDEPTFY